MKLTKFFSAASVGVLALNLAACSSTPSGTGYTAAASGSVSGSGANSAQTYAFNGGKDYQGKSNRNAKGEVVNSLKAPSSQTYYFSYDNSSIRYDDMQAVKVQANYLATHPTAKVRLEGNTDPRGSREYNIGLGWRRDQAVARLFEQEGVLPRQITMVSYGKERPAVLGNNQHSWQLNRRVNMVYEAY